MKKILSLSLALGFVLTAGSLLAQAPTPVPPPPPPPAAVPIDGGLGLLAAAALGLGLKKAAKKNNAETNSEEENV
jgi:hypothetical protein